MWARDSGPDMDPTPAMLQRLYGEDMCRFVRQLLHQHQRLTAAQALKTPSLEGLAAEEVSSNPFACSAVKPDQLRL